ncbi:sensor histidine kinase [Corynebacterium anserum]|nr:HAMP domain-containing sensor histidine kinase [Corynebacterium anserum]
MSFSQPSNPRGDVGDKETSSDLVSEGQNYGSFIAQPKKRQRHFLSRYPLRISLVMVITTLAALGLTGFSAVITTNLQRILVEQVDNQLDSATQTWAHETAVPDESNGWERSPNVQGSVPGNSGVSRPPSEFYVCVVDGDTAVETFNSVFDSLPDVSSLTTPSAPQTVNARAGSASPASWRAASVKNSDGTVTIVALSLESEEHTIARIVFFQVVVGIIVLTLLMAASMYIVRRALRPLNEVEVTASLISRGQLGQRVPPGNPRTEVGRLSDALNRMLQQIQGAFVAVAASERQARKSEASMRRFIGDASHELRTPLTSVRGYAELYTSGATDDANLVIDKISEEAGRMSLLVEDLLALVRMDEGRPMRQDRVDMLELVLATAESTRAAFPGRTINVSNQCGCIPVVIGDSARLHQVMGNLLTNSMRHAGEDAETEVILKVDQKVAPNSVVIEVNDNGVGIPEKDLPHLFDRFYRPDVSRSRHSGGSGLGLSIVKGLVEKHGGSISVRSTLGDGTSFRILLPRAPEADRSVEIVDAEGHGDSGANGASEHAPTSAHGSTQRGQATAQDNAAHTRGTVPSQSTSGDSGRDDTSQGRGGGPAVRGQGSGGEQGSVENCGSDTADSGVQSAADRHGELTPSERNVAGSATQNGKNGGRFSPRRVGHTVSRIVNNTKRKAESRKHKRD